VVAGLMPLKLIPGKRRLAGKRQDRTVPVDDVDSRRLFWTLRMTVSTSVKRRTLEACCYSRRPFSLKSRCRIRLLSTLCHRFQQRRLARPKVVTPTPKGPRRNNGNGIHFHSFQYYKNETGRENSDVSSFVYSEFAKSSPADAFQNRGLHRLKITDL